MAAYQRRAEQAGSDLTTNYFLPESNMDALSVEVHQNGLAQAAPADLRSRPGAGLLAEEAIYGRASHAARHPEAALMCAVLRDAVESFQNQHVSSTCRNKRLGKEAEEWLFSDDSDWVFSFLSICAALDLCPQYIRQGIKGWRKRGQEPAQNQQADVMRMAARSGR
jgi:hypothetical protein